VLHVHRSERADALVAPLAAVLGEPAADPFTPDVVAVPTRGVERWLAQRLSHHLGAGPGGGAGVCANVSFDPPARLVATALAGALGGDPDEDLWDRERLTWPVLETLDAAAHEPWFAPVARYLGEEDDELRRGRRLALAGRLAGLFSRYAAQRPDLLTAWAAGRDEDGAGAPVPGDLAWQPLLWRRVRAAVGVPSPAERLPDALAALRERPGSAALPARLSVFGPTHLPEAQLRVLTALGEHRDVHLWLPHPSPALWQAVEQRAPGPLRRSEHRSPARHPLLASLGRDVAELGHRLRGVAGRDEHHPAPAPPATLLGTLQRELRADAPGAAPHPLDPGDRSVQVHACHGRARQVEVLREVLVGLFADDPDLEPRDVLVMCPDIESYAPLLSATFTVASDGEHHAHPGRSFRVSLADRSPRQVNPLLDLLATLLKMADGRVTASEVLDLAASAPVRRRFGLDDTDLARLREWAVQAGAHWGEDVARRARFGLPDLRQGTWDMALDRILLGAAMAEEDHRYVGAALPLDDVDSTDIELAGRLAELLDRLSVVLAQLTGTRPLTAWLDALDEALTVLADTAAEDAWQAPHARAVLADVRTTGATHEGTGLRLPDVRALLSRRLRGRPTRAGFRTGALTICSLEPMRAVPHRVVCLLGLDDRAFPRRTTAEGDDLLQRAPLVGERDRRSEDRQIFLDAITAAQERLVLLHSGADDRTGATQPPAVPVGELLDALDAATVVPDGGSVRDHVVVHHPLQHVDERNFTDGALGRPGPFSFDALAHRAALAARGPRPGRAPFLSAPLPPEPAPEVFDLDDLVAALEHPVRWFLRERLGVSLAGEVEDVDDALPLELQPLDTWQLGDRLLAAGLAGVDPGHALNAEWRRGQVPPKELGRAVLLDVAGRVEPLTAVARQHSAGEGRAVDVAAVLPTGQVVSGTVPGVHGDAVVRAVYSRLGAKHRLRAWVQLLALAATDPGRPWRAVTIGRPPGTRPGAALAELRAPADPAAHLARLVEVRELARREPLPLPVATASGYATSRLAGNTVEQALEDAERTWRESYERTDAHHVLCWGEDAALRDVAGEAGEAERAWGTEERLRLGALARRVWDPLLDHEEMARA